MSSLACILRAQDQENSRIVDGLKSLISNCLTHMGQIWSISLQ